MSDKWRAEAERLAIEWTRPPYVRIFGQPHDDDSDGDVYLEIDKDALRDAILRLIERVEQDTGGIKSAMSYCETCKCNVPDPEFHQAHGHVVEHHGD